MTRTEGISPQVARTATSDTITTSMAEKTENAFSASNNSVCSNGESGENKHSNGDSSIEGKVSSKESIHYGYR